MDLFKQPAITCFLPYGNAEDMAITVNELRNCKQIGNIFILHPPIVETGHAPSLHDGCQLLPAGSLQQTQTWKTLVTHIDTPYTLLFTQVSPIRLGAYAIERMLQVVTDTNAGMVYADRYKLKDGVLQPHPVNDYQEGSLRDDFDFGALLLFRSSTLKDAVNAMDTSYQSAALYDLRLKVAQRKSLFHLQEYLYTEMETDSRRSGEKLFDYVDPKNRQVQIEMEQVCTRHLKDVGAWLKPEFTPVDFSIASFPVEATVVIPVRNREKTINDAIQSVLMQETRFPFNVIVVDNHSTDHTTEILREITALDRRLIHHIPERNDLGIGGCWNEAIQHPQ